MEEKVFLITGASSGIGKATGLMALDKCYKVVFTSRNASKLLLELQNYLPDNYLLIDGDVSNWEDQQNFVSQTIAKFGRIDICFANAGVLKGSFSFLEGQTTPLEWKEMILTNVYGLALTARATLPEIVKTKGTFIVTSSVVGRVNVAGEVYSATKFAATAMAENIRKEVSPLGVRTILIEPGLTQTDLIKDFNFDLGNAKKLDPKDIAKVIIFAIEQNIALNEIVLRPDGQAI